MTGAGNASAIMATIITEATTTPRTWGGCAGRSDASTRGGQVATVSTTRKIIAIVQVRPQTVRNSLAEVLSPRYPATFLAMKYSPGIEVTLPESGPAKGTKPTQNGDQATIATIPITAICWIQSQVGPVLSRSATAIATP